MPALPDKAFTAMQFIATIVCSFAVLPLSLAFFRPAATARGTVRSLGVASIILLALYAVFQLIAFVLVVVLAEHEMWDLLGESLS